MADNEFEGEVSDNESVLISFHGESECEGEDNPNICIFL